MDKLEFFCPFSPLVCVGHKLRVSTVFVPWFCLYIYFLIFKMIIYVLSNNLYFYICLTTINKIIKMYY